MSDGQAAGQDDDAVALARHRDLHGDRELEVGAGERSWSPTSSAPDPGQHRQGRAAARRRPAGGAEGLDEDITLASELHAGLAFYRRLVASERRSGGRGCGLGMTEAIRWSGGVWLSHGDPQDPTGV